MNGGPPPPPPRAVRFGAPAAASWPITGDVADLLAIVRAQMATVADQEALLHAYQSDLNTAQAAPVTAATGTASGTALTLSAVVGKVLIGDVITGTGIPTAPPATTVLGQTSGVLGGAGVYTTSQATTSTGAALSFTPGGAALTWPTPQDPVTLNLMTQQQTAILRTQNALIQHYQDLLNTSQTAAPPTGP
jgi:hypothetical protein